MSEAEKRNVIFYGDIQSQKTERARTKAIDFTEDKNGERVREIHFEQNENSIMTYEKVMEKQVGYPQMKTSPLQKGESIWNKHNYLDCRGYHPGEMKKLIDKARRPSWYTPRPDINVWTFQLFDLPDVAADKTIENVYEYCKKNNMVLLPPKEARKQYGVNQTATIRLEQYETYMRDVIKEGDFIIVPERGRYIKAFGIVIGKVEEHVVKNSKLISEPEEVAKVKKENLSGNIDYSIWLSRKVDWKMLEEDYTKFFPEIYPRQNIILPYRAKTTAEIIDILYPSPEAVKKVEKGAPPKYAVYIIGINEGGKYSYVFRQIRGQITGDNMFPVKIELNNSENVFWVPDNLMILGVAHQVDRGTELAILRKQFQIIEEQTDEKEKKDKKAKPKNQNKRGEK